MASLQLPKLQLNKYLALSLVMCFCYVTKISADVDETLDWDSLVHAEFQYELFEKSTGIECYGKFVVTVATTGENLPADVDRVMCTSFRSDFNRPASLVKSMKYITGPEVVFEFKRLFWDQLFRVSFCSNDGMIISSPLLNVSDYIAASDLERLQGQLSVESIGQKSVNLEVRDHHLYIDTSDPIALTVFDLNGNSIVSRSCNEPTVISLEYVQGQYIIVHYGNTRFYKTEKFILK